ncbi:MAG TPA: hypothetical protein GX399_09730 [Xanthomonadaceae bacterium]|nr:hypothetical protein [Xanthomonadaceae bacterium]
MADDVPQVATQRRIPVDIGHSRRGTIQKQIGSRTDIHHVHIPGVPTNGRSTGAGGNPSIPGNTPISDSHRLIHRLGEGNGNGREKARQVGCKRCILAKNLPELHPEGSLKILIFRLAREIGDRFHGGGSRPQFRLQPLPQHVRPLPPAIGIFPRDNFRHRFAFGFLEVGHGRGQQGGDLLCQFRDTHHDLLASSGFGLAGGHPPSWMGKDDPPVLSDYDHSFPNDFPDFPAPSCNWLDVIQNPISGDDVSR